MSLINEVLFDDMLTDQEKWKEIHNVVFTESDLKRMEPYNCDWFTLIGVAKHLKEVEL